MDITVAIHVTNLLTKNFSLSAYMALDISYVNTCSLLNYISFLMK